MHSLANEKSKEFRHLLNYLSGYLYHQKEYTNFVIQQHGKKIQTLAQTMISL